MMSWVTMATLSFKDSGLVKPDLDEFVRRRFSAVLLRFLLFSFHLYLLESSFSLQQS